MIYVINIDKQKFSFDLGKPIDISIPLHFNGNQPNAYGVEKATSTPCKSDKLIGDTRKGGSCNFEQYTFIPHCNGTHTECIGHITKERISVQECLLDAFIPATLISLMPVNANETNEIYPFDLDINDFLITKDLLRNSVKNVNRSFMEGLIIRTKPNNENKLTQNYGEYVPPFFSNNAIEFLVEMGVKHLLVDLPSIDRIFDNGKLSNHRKFWNIAEGQFELNNNSRINNTITELIFVSDDIPDGHFLLNLQITPFQADASPSRPILFKVI